MKKEIKNKPEWIGIGVFVSYFIFTWYQTLPLDILGIDYYDMKLNNKIIYLLITELLFVIFLFYVYRKRFITDFKDYIKNFKSYMLKYMEYWALAFGLMLISNFIIVTLFPNSVATNQVAVNEILVKAPYYMIISAVVFAPLIEETVFRLSIRNIFKNDWIFIIISGLTFGALHVIGSFTKWIDLIYIIPYSIPGFVFAYTLIKSKNIFIPISLHLFHNGIMMFIQYVLMFLL